MNNRTMEVSAVVSPWIEAVVIKYGWLGAGVFCGFAAKYGLLVKKGRPITARMILADLLLVGMVSLIAFNAIVKLGLSGEAAALVTSFVAVGGDRGIRMVTERFWRQVDAAMPAMLEMSQVRGEINRTDPSRSALTGAAQSDGYDTDGAHIERLPGTPKLEEN